jgi:hypothetical protein
MNSTQSKEFSSSPSVPAASTPDAFSSGDAARLADCSINTFKSIRRERNLPELRSSNGHHLYDLSTVEAVKREVHRRRLEREGQ